jgi:hypothetical protein
MAAGAGAGPGAWIGFGVGLPPTAAMFGGITFMLLTVAPGFVFTPDTPGSMASAGAQKASKKATRAIRLFILFSAGGVAPGCLAIVVGPPAPVNALAANENGARFGGRRWNLGR